MAKKFPHTTPVNFRSRNLFAQIEREQFANGITPRSQESMDWLRKRAHDIRRVNRNNILLDEKLELKNKQVIGKMFFWFYDPKHKQTLPYYDSFPLGIIVGPAKGGFYALNLHYLPPLLRAQFLDELLNYTNNNKYNLNTKFQITYNMLKGVSKLNAFKPCFKHYLTKHVRSRFAMIPSAEWEIATFLPAADWQKKSPKEVYKFSKELIR